ncbi:MAG: urease accessory protein UreD, partial [Microcystaceae cyanobacterium]
ISPEKELRFTDAMRLEGKHNPFKNCDLFAASPILCNAIAIFPQANLPLLSEQLEDIETANCNGVRVATSLLPDSKGFLIRAIASGTHGLKNYLQYALNCVRSH